MEIKLYDKDIKCIADNVRQGGGAHTALEVALARKCINLKQTIHEINERNNGIFDTLYSIHRILESKYGRVLCTRDIRNKVERIFVNPPFNTDELKKE